MKSRASSNVMPLKRPPTRHTSRNDNAPAMKRVKSHAETVIPFGDEGDDEPPAKISSTAGF
jgi:hypothetical protein